MIKDYLQAGFPALCVLTQEPHRAEEALPCEGWQFIIWDCLRGLREATTSKPIDEIKDPVEALNWLNGYQDTVLICHNLHLFLDSPEVIQAIQNGVARWKSTGCALIMVSPIIQLKPEVEKFFHLVDLPLPDDEELFTLQNELGKPHNIKPNRKAARAAKGLTEFESETAFALSLIRKGYFSTKVISEAKGQMIRKSGLMEFWGPADIADASENLFVYYTGDRYFNKPRGLYRYGADGKVKGPLFGGELGIFKPSQKALEKKIAEDRADACDYFNLADILIRRKKPLRETISLLEKSLELKPDLWIALAYLGLSLKELGEIETAVNCMERAMEHMGCSNMATALIEFYYRTNNREKVWQYFQRMEALEDDVDIHFYSDDLTNEQIEQMLGALVKRNKSNNLVSN